MHKLIVGNWKQNGDISLLSQFKDLTIGKGCKAVICPPYPIITKAASELSNMQIGAQDCSANPSGAFTSQVSAKLLKELGCEYVLIGHSETRMYLGVDTQSVVQKITCAIDAGLKPIVCIGESIDDYKAGRTEAVLDHEVKNFLPFKNDIIIAYEPLWAIGTGLTPTISEIASTLSFIKNIIDVPTLYGGSVTLDNAQSILDIDVVAGLLIGGASLKPGVFEQICAFTN